jgi:Xaa-Pro aminopeptidase
MVGHDVGGSSGPVEKKTMGRDAEIREKERRVREFLQAKGLVGVLLKRQANFSWMTGGGLNLVGITTEVGATSLFITKDAKYTISNNIEAPRMVKEEEVEELGFASYTFSWYEDKEAAIVRDLAGSGRVGCDVPFPDTVMLAEEIARLRYSLTPEEVERYRWLGEKVSLALERTLMDTRKREKESEVVGRLSNGLWKDRIDPVTLMAAADDRVYRFRHPIPTEKRIEKYLMVSVNARKWGLIVSLTRFVHFGNLPEELKEKYLANVFIDCTFMAATHPGIPAKEVLRQGVDAYREKGFPDEWKLHHQGGSIGYTGRDYRTNFITPDVIQENQAFTWNPSLPGTKSEDTILATSRGPEMITQPILYPTLSLSVNGIPFVRPGILEKDE